MQKRIAVVTGGMGGIGIEICRELATAGHQVVVGYNRNGDHQAATAWQDEQKKAGYDFAINYVNVSDYDSCIGFVQQIEERFGSIDILVNNAGITRDRSFHKMTLEQWREVIDTNLNSIFNVTHPAINGMLNRGFGRIINISSVNGAKGQFGQCNYAAAKAGIYGFTKSLALEVANKGITVNSISPGYVATPMVMAVPDEIRQQIINGIPVKRLGEPKEIARTVAFLAAEESGFITGSNLHINGGQYME